MFTNSFRIILILGTAILLLQSAAVRASDDTPLRILNDKEVETCGFGPVMAIKTNTAAGASLCTATLVHPEVIIFAAHCGKLDEIYFGNDVRSPERKLVPKLCELNPDYLQTPTEAYDWGFCTLNEPIRDLPVIPVAYGCELDILSKSGAAVTQMTHNPMTTPSPTMTQLGTGGAMVSAVTPAVRATRTVAARR